MQNRHVEGTKSIKSVGVNQPLLNKAIPQLIEANLSRPPGYTFEGRTEASNFTLQVQKVSCLLLIVKLKPINFLLFCLLLNFLLILTLKCVKGAIKRLNYTVRK